MASNPVVIGRKKSRFAVQGVASRSSRALADAQPPLAAEPPPAPAAHGAGDLGAAERELHERHEREREEELERQRRREMALAAGIDPDEVDEEKRALTEEELDMVSVRCLRIFNILIILIGAGLCGGALYGSTVSGGGLATSLFYAVTGVGGGVFLISVVGLIGALWRFTPLLLAFHVCLVFAAFGMLVLGGFCFILQESAVQWVRSSWPFIQAQLPAAARASLSTAAYSTNMTLAMSGVGLACFFMLLFTLCAMHHVMRLVTPLRGYMLLLEATNTTLVPVGIALVGVSVWVAQTAVGADALYPAFALFVLGIAVVMLAIVGYAGTTLRARGILRLFLLLTVLLALLFLGFSVAAFAAKSRLQEYLTAHWSSLRRLLPSNFAGKYDLDQFNLYLAANLNALGFLALCTGVLLATQSFGAFRLRFEIRVISELEDQVKAAYEEDLLGADEVEQLMALRSKGVAERVWKSWWKRGDCTSRTAVVFLCLFLLFIVAVIVGLAIAALYYSTSCVALSRFAQTFDYGGADIGRVIVVSNRYTRGDITVGVAAAPASAAALAAALAAGWANTTATFHKSAWSESMALAGYPPVQPLRAPWGAGTVDVLLTGNPSAPIDARTIVAVPGPTSKLLGLAVDCQAAEIALTLPPAVLLGGNSFYSAGAQQQHVLALQNSGAQGGVEIDFSSASASNRPRPVRVELQATDGPIEVSSLPVGAKGFSASTTSGSIAVTGMDAQCDPADLGSPSSGGVSFASLTGSVSLDRSSFVDCDLTVTTGAAPAAISNLVFANSQGGGGGRITIAGGAGTVVVSNVAVDFLSITGDAGYVTVSNASIGVSLGASTTSGPLQLLAMQFALGAGLQIDSDSGSVTVNAKAFAGIVSIVTSGPISCAGAGFDSSTPCRKQRVETSADGSTSLNVVDSESVNCAAKSDCPYLGSISITTSRGAVTLNMQKWAR